MAPAWFILTLLLCNLGAAIAFAAHRDWPWCVVYSGASLIQAGCWWMTR